MRFTSNEYLSKVKTSVNFYGSFWLNIFMQDKSKLIMLVDLIEDRKVKQEELQYYEKCLQDLLQKMALVKREINLTETIIDVIKNEKVEVIQDFIEERDNARILDL